jgi:hypothetical protein
MRVLSVSICSLVLAVCAFAQSDRGTITGTVSDPAGAVVANAPIQAKNVDTGVVYEGATSATGNYTLVQLPAGNYEVTVTVSGFKKYTRSGLTVQVAQTLRIDVVLEVGATSDSVTVSEAATLLKTESGELSHNVVAKSLDELPILGIGGTLSGSAGIRNPYSVVQLIPGTTFIPNSLVRINGTPGNSQSFRIEGQDASNTGTPGVPAQTQPGVDAIQEVAVQTSNFAAEYGQVGGGVFNVTMKSGTNQFHGSAYDYFVNEVFNAGNPFTNNPAGNPRPRARRNDYGFTGGGPVWIPKIYNGKDKTFFFFSWEQFRETTEINNQFQTIPIAAYRLGDFTCAIPSNCIPGAITHVIGTDPLNRQVLEGMVFDPASNTTAANGQIYRNQFPNNKVPASSFDPVAAKIQALFPSPSGPTPNGLIKNYLQAYGTHRTTEVPSIKVDQTIGAKGKLSFFYQRTKTSNPDGNTIFGRSDGFPDPITEALGTFQNAPLYRLNYDHSLSPTLLLHVGGGYRSNYFLVPSVTRTGEITNYDAEAQLGLHGGMSHTWFPTISGLFQGATLANPTGNGTGGIKTIGSEAGTNQITQNPTFNANLTSVRNNHTFKFGSEFQTQGYPPKVNGNTLGTYAFSPSETGQPFQTVPVGGFLSGFSYASFLLGQVDTISISRLTTPRMGKKQLGLYAQDTWKVTRKLTLDYGLRYDYSTYLREQYGRAPEFSPTTPNPAVGGRLGAAIYDGSSGPGRCNCDIAHNYPFAFGPRLGVAYQINAKTVLRAGFGIVYGGTATNNNAASGLAGSSATTSPSSFGFPVTTLAAGYPTSAYPPDWPNTSAGQFPTSAPNPGVFGGAFMDQNSGRPARQYQWSAGLQREIFRDMVVEAAYVANRGIWWQSPGLLNLNANTPSSLAAYGLDINSQADRTLLSSQIGSASVAAKGFKLPYAGFPSTQLLAQALRPFPQFTTIPVYWDPLGKSWFDSLQIKATKRFSHGLSFLSTFTWSKSLDIGSEIGEPNPGTTGNAVFNDVFNRNSNKYLSRYDQPYLFNVSLNYTTPGINGNKLLSFAVRDWTFGAFLQYSSGTPIPVPSANSSLNNYLFQGSSFANRVPGQPLTTVDLNCHCYDPNATFVLNPKAWVDPAPGQFGSSAAYYSDYRTQRRPIENMNLGRTFRVKENITFNIRMELTNVFNRAFWSDPAASNANSTQTRLANGNTSSGFGQINTTTPTAFGSVANLLPRQGVVVGRFTF